MTCKIFGIPYPKDFRTEERRKQIAKDAAKIKVKPFEPSDKLAKEMATEVESKEEDKEKEKEEEETKVQATDDSVTLFK